MTTVRTLPLLTLFLFCATASAQVPRLINYQGRAVDSSGPVTGTRQMTLVIYDDPVAGTALFSETHDVTFHTGGVFTVVVGAATSGGIGESIDFTLPYWMGVTIQGFNGDAELQPRYELRSVPYSLRAENANRADVAENAALADSSNRSGSAAHSAVADLSQRARLADSTIKIPHVLGAPGDKPRIAVLEIVDTSRSVGRALQLRGARYALVSDGVDSTSEHYVAGGQAGPTAAPDRGGVYRDNVPLAWGVITPNGSILSDFGIASVSLGSGQVYEVVMDNPANAIPGSNPTTPAFAPQITLGGVTNDGFHLPHWGYKRLPNGNYDLSTIVVRFVDPQGQPATAGFSIVVFGR